MKLCKTSLSPDFILKTLKSKVSGFLHDEQQPCLFRVEKTLCSSEALRKSIEEDFFPTAGKSY